MNKNKERNLEIAIAKLEAVAEHLALDTNLGDAAAGDSVIKADPASKKKLKEFLSKAIASLQTIADERDNYKGIIEDCAKELGVNKKAFRKTATLVHKGKLEEEVKIMEEADEVYTLVSEVL